MWTEMLYNGTAVSVYTYTDSLSAVINLYCIGLTSAFSTLDVAAGKNPTPQKTVSDANLMFEVRLRYFYS